MVSSRQASSLRTLMLYGTGGQTDGEKLCAQGNCKGFTLPGKFVYSMIKYTALYGNEKSTQPDENENKVPRFNV
ncbi:hypothetical protein MPER_07366 [Moniliophthora perniciosa FA553]|nr:hypothetical protein MPER_07366 [Moniliophthora perniciosa FA553]